MAYAVSPRSPLPSAVRYDRDPRAFEQNFASQKAPQRNRLQVLDTGSLRRNHAEDFIERTGRLRGKATDVYGSSQGATWPAAASRSQSPPDDLWGPIQVDEMSPSGVAAMARRGASQEATVPRLAPTSSKVTSSSWLSPQAGSHTSPTRVYSARGWGPGEIEDVVGPSFGTGKLSDMAGEDPWADILAQSSGEFCYVPPATLEHLKKVGEAQLAEIEQLRKQLKDAPQVEAETKLLEKQLADLEAARVMAENEVELRRQEAADLAQEAARLFAIRDSLKHNVDQVQAKVTQLEAWLDPSRQKNPRVHLPASISDVAATAEARLHSRGPNTHLTTSKQKEEKEFVEMEKAIREAIGR